MKHIAITLIGVIVIALLIFAFSFKMTEAERNRTTEDWSLPSGSDINGSWGTEILVMYEDGTSQNLNTPLLDIFFNDKKVSSFQYILSCKGTSSSYNVIEIDMSDFNVVSTIEGIDGMWGIESLHEDTVTITLDDSWNNVYIKQVSADDLSVLGIARYNLSFTPTGSITYRGGNTGSWNYVPLPDWYYMTFSVNTEMPMDDPPVEDPPDDEKWIEVEFGSEAGGG